MEQRYSQWRAMWAISKGALRAIFRSPQAVFFSLFFPIVLIAIFGALSGNRGISVDIAFDKKSDTTNDIYQYIKQQVPVLHIEKADETELLDRLQKGRLTAIVTITKNDGPTPSRYDVHLKSSSASQRDLPVLESILRDVIHRLTPEKNSFALLSSEQIPGRQYRMIDFYLPGMLGFSLIGAAVFGVAFLFYSLRETLVLKRMYATPIRKGYIVLGESIARVLYQLTIAVVIILFGTYFYHFTLAHGWVTFVELLVLSFIGLILFMGFGFVISSVSKNQNVIPIYANLFMFPQYFLSGTFFPKTALPEGMQAVIKYLPLTALNDGMRKVSFEGIHLTGLGAELAILLAWCVVIYAVAIKVFRWD